ncbi:MAG TPA: methyltransferase domain-containing protein [Anaeromyxobacteraceae bacterium]|nr:methyltransferase domain-containing protein [Anaeromyxobacteraceae bacterium]
MATESFRDSWSPARYGRFAAERAAPFDDLLALVEPAPGARLLDVGCGPGELTVRAHRALGASETLGIDPSPAMLERAAELSEPGVRFEQGSAERLPAGPWDVVLSNAALHWVPEHEALLVRLAAALAPGGQLAFQVPANDHHPSHAAAREVAAGPEFRERLGGFTRESPVLPPERYAELLHRLGFARQRVRVEVYLHVLPSREDVVEWVRGSVLTAYEARLPADAWPAFLARYRERLFALVPDERPFPYTYRRVLAWGRLAGGAT